MRRDSGKVGFKDAVHGGLREQIPALLRRLWSSSVSLFPPSPTVFHSGFKLSLYYPQSLHQSRNPYSYHADTQLSAPPWFLSHPFPRWTTPATQFIFLLLPLIWVSCFDRRKLPLPQVLAISSNFLYATLFQLLTSSINQVVYNLFVSRFTSNWSEFLISAA